MYIYIYNVIVTCRLCRPIYTYTYYVCMYVYIYIYITCFQRWALSNRHRPRDHTKEAAGDDVFHIRCLFPEEAGLWVWVSFMVLKRRNKKTQHFASSLHMDF